MQKVPQKKLFLWKEKTIFLPQNRLEETNLYSPQPAWNLIEKTHQPIESQQILTSMPLKETNLLLICGVSTAGKNTLLTQLNQSSPVHSLPLIPRATTRPPRPGEKDKKDYFFLHNNLTSTPFSHHHVFLWSEYGGHYYAITQSVIERLSTVKTGCMIQGLLYGFALRSLLKPYGTKVTICYILPSKMKKGETNSLEVIQKRLANHHSKSYYLRLESIKRELKFVFQHQHQLTKKGIIFIENLPHSLGFYPPAVAALQNLVSQINPSPLPNIESV